MTEQEFKETVFPHHSMMLAEAMRLLKNRDEALDCLQDAVTSLWKSRRELSKVSNIKAYCIRSVTNRALEMMRQRHIPYSEYYNKDLPSDVTAASEVERRENVAALRKAIKLLPENERKVVLMKAINGMSSDEIAESTGFTATNIRVLLHRGSKRIKEYLKKKKGIQGEHIYISSENWKRISEYFNFNYIPFGVLIGKDGNLIKTHFYLDGQNAEKEIERHLRE